MKIKLSELFFLNEGEVADPPEPAPQPEPSKSEKTKKTAKKTGNVIDIIQPGETVPKNEKEQRDAEADQHLPHEEMYQIGFDPKTTWDNFDSFAKGGVQSGRIDREPVFIPKKREDEFLPSEDISPEIDDMVKRSKEEESDPVTREKDLEFPNSRIPASKSNDWESNKNWHKKDGSKSIKSWIKK